MLELKKIHDKAYWIRCESFYELGMLFLRYQEFYESPFDHIKGKNFTIAEFISTYTKWCGSKNDRNESFFSYPNDNGGYNIPLKIIDQVNALGIKDMNHYDSLMNGLKTMIIADSKTPDCYIIGTFKGADEKEYFQHELAHTMFYCDQNYRQKITFIIDKALTDDELKKALINLLISNGSYSIHVFNDELQAYLSTGYDDMFDNLNDELQERLLTLSKDIQKVYDEHVKIFCNIDDIFNS